MGLDISCAKDFSYVTAKMFKELKENYALMCNLLEILNIEMETKKRTNRKHTIQANSRLETTKKCITGARYEGA